MKRRSKKRIAQAAPGAHLKRLTKLVGAWRVTGGVQGKVSYEWMDGRHFMIQRFDLRHDGRKIKGIEIIGHLKPFGENPGKEICSRAYDNMGNTFDYVYELRRNTLIIWGGEKGSTSFFKGVFSKDGRTNTGAWKYPGGGYHSIMTRI